MSHPATRENEDAHDLAMSETNLPRSAFPETYPYTVEGLFTMDLSGLVD